MPGVWMWSGSSEPVGTLDPDHIHTPGIFVQRIFQGTNYQKHIERVTTRPKPETV